MPSWRSRVLAVATVAVMGVLVPGVAHAAPPDNDDFAASTPIAALPFTVEQDTSAATKAPDDPSWCQSYNVRGSVWYHYTATKDAILRATSAGSDRDMIISAHTGQRGDLRGVDNSCTSGRRYPATFRVTAGTTYHFMISGYDSPGGALKFSLDEVAPAANDNFAAAQPVGALPFTAEPDLTVASFEADEPESSCVYDEKDPSVWYSYTPTTTAVSLVPKADGDGEAALTVYTGADITSLKGSQLRHGQLVRDQGVPRPGRHHLLPAFHRTALRQLPVVAGADRGAGAAAVHLRQRELAVRLPQPLVHA